MSSTGIPPSRVTAIETVYSHLKQHSIPIATAHEDPSLFSEWQQSYTGTHPSSIPGVIARPTTPAQVSTIISIVVSKTSLDIVVRGGGHDVFGRFTAKDAVCIDLKDLNTVTVSEDRKTVRVSGGATAFDVVRVLDVYGLQVPTGGCGLVGYVGWCIIGGFGPYSHLYGLGVDQIVGARVVNAKGEIFEAGERLLKGLRGGGGNFGVIVELTIKTYPKTEVQAGMILYDSTSIPSTVKTFFQNYARLLASSSSDDAMPNELYLLPSFWNFPNLGLTMACSYIWTGPATSTSALWLDRALALAPLHAKLPPPKILPTTSLGFLENLGKVIPTSVYGRSQGAAIESWTPEVIDAIATIASNLPTTSSGAFHVHTIRPSHFSLSEHALPSVCPYRQPSILFDFLGLAANEDAAADSARWALEGRDLLMSCNGAGKKAYLAQTSPERTDLRGLYGAMLDELLDLKTEFDPEGVFCFAVPKLSEKRRDPTFENEILG